MSEDGVASGTGTGRGPVLRFVHTSDWHLGMTRRFLSAEGRERFRQARLDAVTEIGRVAAAHDAAFVVVAGDVFDDNRVDRRTVVRCCEALRTIACPVVLLPGNHDAAEPGSVWESSTWRDHVPDHVIVLDRPGVHRVPVADPNRADASAFVEIVAAPWRSRRPLADGVGEVLAALATADDLSGGRAAAWNSASDAASDAPLDAGSAPRPYRVLLGHGSVAEASGGLGDEVGIDLARLERAITDGLIDVAVLGDRHSRTALGDTGRVHYAGTPEVTAPREDDPGHVLVVELGPDECSVEPVRVGHWRMLEHHAELDGDEGVDALERWLADRPDKDRTFVRLGVTGTVGVEAAARLDVLVDMAGEVFAGLARTDQQWHLTVDAGLDDLDAIAISGPVRAAADELARAAAGGDEEASAALSLLRRCAREAG